MYIIVSECETLWRRRPRCQHWISWIVKQGPRKARTILALQLILESWYLHQNEVYIHQSPHNLRRKMSAEINYHKSQTPLHVTTIINMAPADLQK